MQALPYQSQGSDTENEPPTPLAYELCPPKHHKPAAPPPSFKARQLAEAQTASFKAPPPKPVQPKNAANKAVPHKPATSKSDPHKPAPSKAARPKGHANGKAKGRKRHMDSSEEDDTEVSDKEYRQHERDEEDEDEDASDEDDYRGLAEVAAKKQRLTDNAAKSTTINKGAPGTSKGGKDATVGKAGGSGGGAAGATASNAGSSGGTAGAIEEMIAVRAAGFAGGKANKAGVGEGVLRVGTT